MVEKMKNQNQKKVELECLDDAINWTCLRASGDVKDLKKVNNLLKKKVKWLNGLLKE